MPKKQTPEGLVQAAILSYLDLKGIFHFRINNTGIWHPTRKIFFKPRHLTPGVSDILGIYKQRFLAIEVKSSKGKVSPEQTKFLEEVIANGGIGFVARSVQDVIDGLLSEPSKDVADQEKSD